MTIEMQYESTMQLFLVDQTASRLDVLLSKLQDCYSGNDAHQMHPAIFPLSISKCCSEDGLCRK